MSTSRGSILIVEDSHDLQDLLSELLGSVGYQVACADNGIHALKHLRATEKLPGLILLDYMMPQMDGEQFRIEQLKDARLSQIPVVMVTADGNMQMNAAHLRPQAILRKPFNDVDTIVRTVDRFFLQG